MAEKIEVRYRTWFKGVAPRPIKLQVPGWSGDKGYRDGCEPQPWHCKPFVDAATYGLELVYPFQNELTVSTLEDGTLEFIGEFTEEEKSSKMMPPFQSFAPHHYGFTSSVDLAVPSGLVTRIEPHPRFYTDRVGDVPIPVAGHLETEWWTRIFFVAFKSPLPGQKHVFRNGEGYAQLLFVPKDAEYDVVRMSAEEGGRRACRDEQLGKYGKELSSRIWNDHKNQPFNNRYKVLSKVYDKEGVDGVNEYIAEKIFTEKVKPKRMPGFRLKTNHENI